MTENTIQMQPVPEAGTVAGLDTIAIAASDAAAVTVDDVGADIVEEVAVVFPDGAPPIGPAFAPEAEPVNVGTTYQALDGSVYYRPVWRIPDRHPRMLPGPDVWFLRDNQGTIRLQWTLADPPPADAPAGAKSLVQSIDAVTLRWNGGSREFERPRLGRYPEPEIRQAWAPVHMATALHPDEARTLELAMSDAASGCRLEVVHTAWYFVHVPEQPVRTPRIFLVAAQDEEDADELNRIAEETHYLDLDGTRWWVVIVAESDVGTATDLLKALGVNWWSHDELVRWQPALSEVLGEARFFELAGLPPPRAGGCAEQITQEIPFVFNPNDDANRLIYRSLHGAANLTDQWRKSSAGWLRDSGFPNTVYRIPDEMRLAFDPDLGTPHVVLTLHKDDQGATSVRVLLRVAPWQDPRKILETRELVRSEAARVIVGPVQGATLRLGGSFPEGIQVLGGDVSVPLSEGVDLLMDLSLEYFQLLSGMIGGAVGLPGEVQVALGDGSEAASVPVPVSLRMDRVNNLPVAVQVLDEGTISPTAVQLTNRSGTAIRIGGCEAVFLQIDDSSVVPLAAYAARCTSTFPLELAKDATVDLTFEQVEPQERDEWNAVLVELLDKELVDDARTLLLRANELAGSGELTWDVTISSPVFAAALPERWESLISIEVEVSAPGFHTTTIVLRKDSPVRTLTMRKPLSDLVAGGAAGIQTATYRVRNNYLDHQGQWTEPQQQSGEELVVYPNPAPGD